MGGSCSRILPGCDFFQVSRFYRPGRDPRFLASMCSAPGQALWLSGGLVLAQVSRFCHPGRDPQVFGIQAQRSRSCAQVVRWSGSCAGFKVLPPWPRSPGFGIQAHRSRSGALVVWFCRSNVLASRRSPPQVRRFCGFYFFLIL